MTTMTTTLDKLNAQLAELRTTLGLVQFEYASKLRELPKTDAQAALIELAQAEQDAREHFNRFPERTHEHMSCETASDDPAYDHCCDSCSDWDRCCRRKDAAVLELLKLGRLYLAQAQAQSEPGKEPSNE